MWAVLVFRTDTLRGLVVGAFHDEVKADKWRDRLNEGYVNEPGFNATTEWLYTAAADVREPLKEAIDDLLDEEARYIVLEVAAETARESRTQQPEEK